jgi:1,4-dihydroxy-2-naphthoate octaprenyltransferase
MTEIVKSSQKNMSKSTRSDTKMLRNLFLSLLVITLAIYVLRGLGILTFIPGGIILIAIALSIISGILYGIRKTQRF